MQTVAAHARTRDAAGQQARGKRRPWLTAAC
jgi:hypothetical protein